MSHWQSGKLQLKCSMGVLKRALINIVPEWERNIQEDESGQLSATNQYYGQGTRTGFKIVVKMAQADVGFKQEADGTWSAVYDAYVLPRQIKGNLEGAVLQEVSAMRAKAVAQIQGLQIVKDSKMGDERVIEMLVPITGPGMKA